SRWRCRDALQQHRLHEGALRKAARKGIGLIGVMKEGDQRIRVLIPEALYIRQIQIDHLSIHLHYEGQPIDLSGVPVEAITFEGAPVGNWLLRRVFMTVAHNLIVNCDYVFTHQLTKPLTIDLPDGPTTVDRIDYGLAVSGAWFAQDVTFDGTTALYD